ncbi:hypothetical protein PFISCL1PPCAC_22618, partial [Pristionchus fissidentatus]
ILTSSHLVMRLLALFLLLSSLASSQPTEEGGRRPVANGDNGTVGATIEPEPALPILVPRIPATNNEPMIESGGDPESKLGPTVQAETKPEPKPGGQSDSGSGPVPSDGDGTNIEPRTQIDKPDTKPDPGDRQGGETNPDPKPDVPRPDTDRDSLPTEVNSPEESKTTEGDEEAKEESEP